MAKNFLLDTWNKIPPMGKTAIVLVGGYVAFKRVNKLVTDAEAEKLRNQALDPRYNLPPSTWSFPGGDTVNSPQTNFAQVAQEIYAAYNPNGWSTDEAAMMDIIARTDPKYFKAVAGYYYQQYGRDLTRDMDEQLGTDIVYGGPWKAYKTRIV